MKKQSILNGGIILTHWYITLRRKEKYADPRILYVELTADHLHTKNHPDTSIHNDRVMPLVSIKKFCSKLRAKTRTFKTIDDSHFWVSGYYCLRFYLKSAKDRAKIKKLVAEALSESGGFMGFDAWYEKHTGGHTRILQYNGSGSGITNTYSNLPDIIAFL